MMTLASDCERWPCDGKTGAATDSVVVFFAIFLLLYMVLHSATEAAVLMFRTIPCLIASVGL